MILGYSLGAPELLIILVVVLLLFGASRLPKLAKSLGEAKKEFENSTSTPAPANAPANAPASTPPEEPKKSDA